MVRSTSRSRAIWLFNSLDFSGNPKWLFLYVLAKHPEIDAHWIADTDEKAAAVRRLGFPATTYADKKLQERTGVYVVNQVKEQIPPELVGAVLLNLWHGVGVKLIERQMKESELLPRIAEKYIRNNKLYRDNMILLVTSPLMEGHFQRQIDPRPEQVIRADYPQNSVPRALPGIATFEHDLRAEKGLGPATRIVVWAPTYRLSGNERFAQRALPDMERLIDVLERTDQLLILKMHPRLLSDPSFRRLAELYAKHPRIHVWDNTNDIYEVFDQVDTAIIDYSSIHYDLLAAGVGRFIRYAFDLDEPGALEPGLDYLKMSVGTLARDFDELLVALQGDNSVPKEEIDRISDHFWSYRADTGPDTIIDAAMAYEPGDVQLPTLYTFDIFDTIIHRRGVLPRSIFLGIRDRMLRVANEWPTYFVHRFEEIRVEAERSCREARRKDPRRAASNEFEISLDEIYDRIAHVYEISSEQRDQLRAWEIEVELSDVLPDVPMVDRVVALREAGERVLFVSDMYLPKDVIRAMLVKADPRLADVPVYVSGEFGVQKSTAALYARIFAEVDYDYGDWVHVGDNPHADGEMAQQIGITSTLISPTELDELETQLLDQAGSRDGALVAGLFRNKRLGDTSRAELFAYRHVAGLLVPYVVWAVDDAIARGYQTLYFVARDGHFLKIIADAYIAETGSEIKTRYLYGSRRAWRLASQLDELAPDMFAEHGIFGGSRKLSDIARQAHLTTAELIAMIPDLETWHTKGNWDPTTRNDVLAVLRGSLAFQQHLLERARNANALAQQYLRQEIDFDERFALVDYWGRGYTQDCLVDIFRSMGLADPTAPFYYARSIYPSEGESIRYNYTSAAYELTLVELILANQPQSTTLGYALDEVGRVQPVFEPREHNAVLREATERMIAAFTRDVIRLPVLDLRGVLHETFRFLFEHYRAQPIHEDYIEFLAPLRDSITMGDKEREFAPTLTLREYIRILRTLSPGEVTRSLPLSVKRSTLPVRFVAMLQQRIGLRRWLILIKSRLRS